MIIQENIMIGAIFVNLLSFNFNYFDVQVSNIIFSNDLHHQNFIFYYHDLYIFVYKSLTQSNAGCLAS